MNTEDREVFDKKENARIQQMEAKIETLREDIITYREEISNLVHVNSQYAGEVHSLLEAFREVWIAAQFDCTETITAICKRTLDKEKPCEED